MKRDIHVMVVDDEAVFVRNLCRLLETRGFNVSVAFDGYTAMARLHEDKEKSVALVLLDVKMPGMNGNEVLSRIKSMRPDVEVLMLTGHGDVDSGVNAIREGAFDYLLKPCDIDLLTEKIHEALTAEQMRRQPILGPRQLVKEATDSVFLPLRPDDSLTRALEIFEADSGLIKENLHVVDPSGHLSGIITKTDLIQVACLEGLETICTWEELVAHPEWLPRMPVGELMEKAPANWAEPEEPLTGVAERMIANNLRSLPVIDASADNRFLGVIHLKDILDYVACREEESDYF